jgi:hypothetical protein
VQTPPPKLQRIVGPDRNTGQQLRVIITIERVARIGESQQMAGQCIGGELAAR